MHASWDEIAETFSAAVEVPAAERDAWLDNACAGRPELRREIEAMLAANEPGARLDIEEELSTAAEPQLREGMHLGSYRIIRALGRGGMGEVYLGARTDDHSEQLVAIKVLRTGVASVEAAARFHRERRILAHLTHPAIVSMIDSGVARDGRPYLVLQYVDGQPITRYCDEQKLSVDARLRLFVTVCRAVQYAHGRLIIHRDLKPSNILVTRDGEPRLLDFGIAKALSPDDEETDLTRHEPAPMTPERAAPEQLRGDRPSTATDVWALGVLLYELVAGRLPFAHTGRSRTEIERALTDKPISPAAAIWNLRSTDPVAATQAAAARATTVERLRTILRGDVETVISTALRREPELRYASAGQLADDVERVLEGQPILARPQSVAYRIRRFAGRNRFAVAASAVALVSLIAFTGMTAMQSARISRERDRASTEEARANAVVELLTEVLEGPEPARNAPTREVNELLARGEKRAAELSGEPAVQARVWHALGKAYAGHSELTKAKDLQTRAYFRQVAIAGTDDIRSLEISIELARVDAELGFRGAAARRARDAILRLESRAKDHPALLAKALHVLAASSDRLNRQRPLASRTPPMLIAESLNLLGVIGRTEGESDVAEHHWRETLDILQKQVGPDHPHTLAVEANLALTAAGLPERERRLRDLIAAYTRLHGNDDAQISLVWNNLGTTLAQMGEFDRAVAALEQAQEIWARMGGADYEQSLNTRRNLAEILTLTGRHEESLAELRRILETAERSGVRLAVQASLRAQTAAVLCELGRLDEARREMWTAYDDVRRVEPEGARNRSSILYGVAILLLAEGKYAEAEAEFSRVIAAWGRILGADHPSIDQARLGHGRALIGLGRTADGRALIERSLERARRYPLAHRAEIEAAERALRGAGG